MSANVMAPSYNGRTTVSTLGEVLPDTTPFPPTGVVAVDSPGVLTGITSIGACRFGSDTAGIGAHGAVGSDFGIVDSASDSSMVSVSARHDSYSHASGTATVNEPPGAGLMVVGASVPVATSEPPSSVMPRPGAVPGYSSSSSEGPTVLIGPVVSTAFRVAAASCAETWPSGSTLIVQSFVDVLPAPSIATISAECAPPAYALMSIDLLIVAVQPP